MFMQMSIGSSPKSDASSPSSRREPKCICPADVVLGMIAARWATSIIERIGEYGSLHFGALKRAVPGISKKVLTEQLRRLERARILRREHIPAARPQMLYSLTTRGQELKNVIDSLGELGARWQREDVNDAAFSA